MNNTNHKTAAPSRTAAPPFNDELLEEETDHLSLTEPMAPDLEMLKGGDLSKRQNAVVDEAGVHITAQQAHLVKDKVALDNSLRFNEYSTTQVVDLLIRSDFTQARVVGRPCIPRSHSTSAARSRLRARRWRNDSSRLKA